MHAIEYDGAAPNPAAPWLVRTDDGAEWRTTDEAKAALQLAAWIMRRQQQDAQVQAEQSVCALRFAPVRSPGFRMQCRERVVELAGGRGRKGLRVEGLSTPHVPARSPDPPARYLSGPAPAGIPCCT